MRLSELQYELPSELIAQRPVEPRDASRLLVLDRASGRITHTVFREIGTYLTARACLVLNNTRVIPARFFCRRVSGGRIEGLFLHVQDDAWRVMLKPAARLKVGEALVSPDSDVRLVIVARLDRGEWLARPEPAIAPLAWLARVGQTPLPPYIHRGMDGHGTPDATDAARYQTVYAERPGAVAAPTAGLHFTPALLAELARGGVQRATVTLHVGAGTFIPIEAEDLAQHRMHAEWYEVTPPALATLCSARASGQRLVAVGTTAARVLESLPAGALDTAATDTDQARSAWTDIFIYPPYRFRHVDHLITNFHLPGSTLLALVMAFASPELIRAAYAAAIAERYRFYSYGDAMLIL